jgi:general secretion pathway protein B
MSSILKALKRLEEEKAAKYGERVDSAGGILRGSVGSRRSHVPLVAGIAVLTAVVAVIVTYAFMGGFHAKPQSTAVPVIPQSVPAPVPSLQPPAPAALPERPVLPATSPVRPQARPEAAKPAPAPVTPPAAAVAPEAVQPKPAATDTAFKPAPAPPAPSTPVLKVSAIAWQKEGAGLIAMVNGTSVGAGEKVGGARVEEILPDRVRFSHEGRSFEILLGKSAPEK